MAALGWNARRIERHLETGESGGGFLPRIARLLQLLALSVLLCVPAAARGESANIQEYQVKAAFLYNFTKFVEWPDTAFPRTDSDLAVCVVGDDPFGSVLDSIKGKIVKNRKVVVRRLSRIEDLKECQILFISASEKKHLPRILSAIKRMPVLTVADFDGFTQVGGMIILVTIKNKVVFEINSGAASRAGLRISAQLLKLAREIVE